MGAAYTLQKREWNHILFESDSHPGGRVKTEYFDGFHIDIGANFFLETYETVHEVAAELGVPMKRTPVPLNGAVYHNGRFHCFYGGGTIKNRLKTLNTFLSFGLLSPRGVWQLLKYYRILRGRGSDLRFDDHSQMLDLDAWESMADFLESEVGSELLEKFVQPSLSSFTFGSLDDIGAPYGMAAAWQFGLNGSAWTSMPELGPGVFADALFKACQENVRLSAPVERIIIENDAVQGIILKGSEKPIVADAVICATNAPDAIRIAPGLPSEIVDVLRKANYSKCCRVVLGLDENPFPPDWYAVAFPEKIVESGYIAGMSNSAVLVPKAVPEGKALVDAFVIGDKADEMFQMTDEDAVQTVVDESRRYFPKIPERPLFSRVHRWKEAVCTAPGGMMTAMHDLQQTAPNRVKGLYFAGDYMGVPSTTGALRSGILAAEMCVEMMSDPGSA